VQRLEDGLKQVADTQQNAATLAQNYELGLENDLAKVMVGQQVSSLGVSINLKCPK
jgi:flagellar hook-basal body complex protein FliE